MIATVLANELLIIDIETASAYGTYDEMPIVWQQLWNEKIRHQLPAGETAAGFYSRRAGILAEFGRVVCISAGYFSEGSSAFEVRSFSASEEKLLLQDFISFINEWGFNNANGRLGGHNIREFDVPFLCRRMLINNLTIPDLMDWQHKKPWEVKLLDTFQYWRFGDYKNYTSLDLLCNALNVPSSKNDIDGSEVGALFWEQDPELKRKNIRRIANYCSADVLATANVILRLMGIPLVENHSIIEKEE